MAEKIIKRADLAVATPLDANVIGLGFVVEGKQVQYTMTLTAAAHFAGRIAEALAQRGELLDVGRSAETPFELVRLQRQFEDMVKEGNSVPFAAKCVGVTVVYEETDDRFVVTGRSKTE